MLLSPEQILDIVHGTLFTAVTPEGEVSFYRFTEKQQKEYAASEKSFGIKCYASAGVMLDFSTDSNALSFTAEFTPGSSQNYADIDVLIDNVLYYNEGRTSLGVYDFNFALPEGSHRITVVLPWSTATKLRNITLDDGATVIPVEKSLRILAIGDSITQGYISHHPSLTYVNCFTRALDAEVLNQGIGGYRFFKESIDPELGWQPDIITLAYGTNDYSHLSTKEEFTEYAASYVDALCCAYPDTPILGIIPIYRNGEEALAQKAVAKNGFTFYEAMDILKDVYAAHKQVTILDGLSFYPRLPEFFAPDYLHPNELGFSIYGKAVETALREML